MNTPVSDIEAREKAATPEPWVVGASAGVEPAHLTIVKEAPDKLPTRVIGQVFPHCDNYRLHRSTLEADAEFIAHAREDIPYLLAQLKDRDAKLANVGSYSSELWAQGGPQRREVSKRLDRILKGGE